MFDRKEKLKANEEKEKKWSKKHILISNGAFSEHLSLVDAYKTLF